MNRRKERSFPLGLGDSLDLEPTGDGGEIGVPNKQTKAGWGSCGRRAPPTAAPWQRLSLCQSVPQPQCSPSLSPGHRHPNPLLHWIPVSFPWCSALWVFTSLFSSLFLKWSIVDLQCCVSFWCTTKGLSYTYVYIFFFIFFSTMVYYRILSIVPRT